MIPVHATSIVALDAEEAYFVTLHPKPLNSAIENINETSKTIITGL